MASESLPLQGFTVKLTERPDGEESSNVFHLYHKKTLCYTFRADDPQTARRSEQKLTIQILREMKCSFITGAEVSLKSAFPDRESNPGRGGESAES